MMPQRPGTVDFAWRRTTLRHTPKDERKIALILPNGLHRDDRIDEGHPGSRDIPQAAVDLLRALDADGYRVTDLPADGVALIRALHAASIDDAETFPRSDYGIFFNDLPGLVQDSVSTRWGAPERDPFFREGCLDCGSFVMPAIRCGNIIVAIEPSRGSDIASKVDGLASTQESPPPHSYLAFYAWLADGVRVHAVVHFGKSGDLKWLLGDGETKEDIES